MCVLFHHLCCMAPALVHTLPTLHLYVFPAPPCFPSILPYTLFAPPASSITTPTTGGVIAKEDGPQFIKGLVALLRPTLEVIAQQPGLHDPSRGRGGPTSAWTAAAAQLQLALLRVYGAVPGCGAYAKDHEALIRVTSRPVRTGGESGTGD